MATPPAPFRLVGARRQVFRDAYHAFLWIPWPAAIGAIAAAWLGLNAIFAAAYLTVGGVANMRPGSFADAFFFSVQTMGTIGYGVMAPQTVAANVLVVVESVTGLIVTAVATGLVFAKFGRTPTRVAFANQAVIGSHDGTQTLTVRVGNERFNRILDVRFKIMFVRTEHTKEGQTIYRMYDLDLVRSQAASLMSTYLVQARIGPDSVMAGYDAARMKADEAEVHVVVTGLDETTLQPVHAIHAYLDGDIAWGSRYADMLSEQPDGTIEVDLRKFHEVVPDGSGASEG